MNHNTIVMFPKKSINLLFKVHRKRQTMNEELLHLGIGKKFADNYQVNKLKTLGR